MMHATAWRVSADTLSSGDERQASVQELSTLARECDAKDALGENDTAQGLEPRRIASVNFCATT